MEERVEEEEEHDGGRRGLGEERRGTEAEGGGAIGEWESEESESGEKQGRG